MQKNQQKKQVQNVTIWVVTIFLIVVAASFFIPKKSEEPKNLDSLAQCLKDKGVKFYGAFWCSHCNNQKKAFGNSQKLLPYIECSTPDGKGQTKECQDANVDGYPTWVFPDGSRQSGEVPLSTLAEKTGCQLPQ